MSMHKYNIVEAFLYIKKNTKMIVAGDFFLQWVSTLNPDVHVCYLYVMVYFVPLAHG